MPLDLLCIVKKSKFLRQVSDAWVESLAKSMEDLYCHEGTCDCLVLPRFPAGKHHGGGTGEGECGVDEGKVHPTELCL